MSPVLPIRRERIADARAMTVDRDFGHRGRAAAPTNRPAAPRDHAIGARVGRWPLMAPSLMGVIRRLLFVVCTLLFLLGPPVVPAQVAVSGSTSAIPVHDFFRLPEVWRPTLSPDGNFLAFLARGGTRLALAVIDIERRTSAVIATLPEADVVEFHWVNSQRIVFVSGNVYDPVGAANVARAGGLFAVDKDGTQARRLALPYGDGSSALVRPRFMRFEAALGDGSDDIIVTSNERNFDASDVYRLNTRSARKTLLSFDNPGDVQQWALDRDGMPRGAVSLKGLNARVSFRRDDKSAWVKWSEGDFREPQTWAHSIGYDGSIIGFGYREPVMAQSAATPKLRGTAAMLRLDERGQALQVLAGRDDADMAAPIFDPVAKKLVGARFYGTREQVQWLDEGWAAIQRQIDQAQPGAVNYFVPPEQGKRMIVFSYSDRNPGTVFLFDFRTRKLEFLIESRPWIKAAHMAESRVVKFAARDDLPLTAVLTTPRGGPAKNLPLIVIVHGGPWVPGYTWRWDAEAQFFASRGYAVIQPNFRGTTGMGAKHLLASFKQWGLAMQDDITDAAQWAVRQGVADAKRMCVFGASYGGYAAMQALVKTPELFQCAVNYSGVTDLQLFHSVTWSDMSDSDFAKFRAPVMVGDPDRDRAQLQATSPAQNADRIIKPVLMAYGGEDRRVPIIHGERMRDALEKLGKPVEWIVKTDEGHGFVKLENRVELYSRVESFFRRHLAKP